jgi:serine/threonine protein kinase
LKFLVVEEYLPQGTSVSLRNLLRYVGDNKLMRKYMSERAYIMRMLVQILKAVKWLNERGEYHGDINPSNIIIRFPQIYEMEDLDKFRVQVIEGLRIKNLVERAMRDQ